MSDGAAAAAEAFVRAHTAIARPKLVPEIALHLATEITPIWQATETWLARADIAPPFWAFAWPGGQALARLLLDQPARVAGRRVLDFAAGCGIAAIAAARAGVARVEAAEIDPLAAAATRLNAALNGVAVATIAEDLVGAACRWDTVLAGDVCYEAPMTRHILPWLRALAGAGAEVLLADPGRAYLPRDGLAPPLARFAVPTTRELEDREMREVTIRRLLPWPRGAPEHAARRGVGHTRLMKSRPAAGRRSRPGRARGCAPRPMARHAAGVLPARRQGGRRPAHRRRLRMKCVGMSWVRHHTTIPPSTCSSWPVT